MFKQARNEARLTLEQASFRIPCGRRNLCKYEAGQVIPGPDVVLGMSRAYRRPEMTQIYCREFCAIGREYGYDYLDAVSLDPMTVLAKLGQELHEAEEVYSKMVYLAVNKRSREDFTAEEWEEFLTCALELLDVEHNVEAFKISLGRWCDESVVNLIRRHNEKCLARGYVRPKQTKKEAALAMAAT